MCTSTRSQLELSPEFWLTGPRRLNHLLLSLSFQTHRIFVLAAARMLLHVAEFPFILIIFRLLHRVTTVNPPPPPSLSPWFCLPGSAPFVAAGSAQVSGLAARWGRLHPNGDHGFLMRDEGLRDPPQKPIPSRSCDRSARLQPRAAARATAHLEKPLWPTVNHGYRGPMRRIKPILR